MSKFDEAVEKYAADLDEMGGYDAELLRKVTKGLGPSIYNDDSSKVAASDKDELATVKNNFLIKKLGLEDSEELDEAIAAVAKEYNKRFKHRAVFYYKLVKALGQESHYA